MDINNIPLELLIKFLSYIPQNDLYHTISQVCRHWNKLSILPDFWRTFNYDELSILSRSSAEQYFYLKMENRVAHIRNIQTFIQKLSINRFGFQEIQNSRSQIAFSDLKHLHITDEISGQLCKDVLKRCSKLHALDLQMYNTMIYSFDLICGLNLKEIKLCLLLLASKTINNDLTFLTETNPNLEKLALDVTVRYGNLLDAGVHLQILNQCRNLKTLALRNFSVSSKGFMACGINLGLTELTIISNSYLFDDNGIECITIHSKNLLVLKILECNKITDKSIASIAENCHVFCVFQFIIHT
ncbi:unnamed protein product [Mytilus edulis]|uniref:F-box domain-containing protein n=1 Tax=Mytilus edulis TaxID=6550 RepID=A0A8S3UW19_MYTED|nr:unnamed protein product [Mytilus edulis]